MYGFKITTLLTGAKPCTLDEITDQLTIMCSCQDEFEDFIVVRCADPSDTTFLIVVNSEQAEAIAMTRAITWLHTALNAALNATPGWLRLVEQVFTWRTDRLGRSA